MLGKAARLLDLLAERGELTVQALADAARSRAARSTGCSPGCVRSSWWSRARGAARTAWGSSCCASPAPWSRASTSARPRCPAMERLHEQTEETVFLSVPRGREAVCIERIDGRWVQSMALTLGGGLPLHIGAGPRRILAPRGRPAWMEYLAGGPLEPFTAALAHRAGGADRRPRDHAGARLRHQRRGRGGGDGRPGRADLRLSRRAARSDLVQRAQAARAGRPRVGERRGDPGGGARHLSRPGPRPSGARPSAA